MKHSIALFMILAVCGLFPVVEAQDSAGRATSLFNAYKNSVVRITASGSSPKGVSHKEFGSGFVVAYEKPWLFIVTAGHVVGSSSPRQIENADWFVDAAGRVDRKIEVSAYDVGGVWREIGQGEHVPLLGGAAVDLALIVVTDGPELAPLPLMRSADRSGTREVMLMGYRGDGRHFRTPIPMGKGARTGFNNYSTDQPSLKGESGGPWIDLRGGSVIAVASRVDTSPDSPSTLAVPSDFVVSAVGALLIQKQASLKIYEEGGAFTRFAILNIDGSAQGQIGGGKILAAQQTYVRLGETLRLASTGNERSDCDPGSGLTSSAAEVYAKVMPSATQDLVFDYKLGAQGGHFRTAIAGCLGPNLIGLKGNDTDAAARVQMQGSIGFEAQKNQGLSLKWLYMPTDGATYKLIDDRGAVVQTGNMTGSDVTKLQLPKTGIYRLETTINRSVTHIGAAGAPLETGQAQVAIKPDA